MMIWATLLFSGLALFVLVVLTIDEVRARVGGSGVPSPLAGLTRADVIMLLLYFVPIIIAGIGTIRYVLT